MNIFILTCVLGLQAYMLTTVKDPDLALKTVQAMDLLGMSQETGSYSL